MPVTNPYADGDDVQAFLNQLGGTTLTLGAGSTPTLAQVEGWLDNLAAEVDSVLKSVGYGTLPATGTNDILLIQRFVAQKGACMAYHAGYQFDDLPDKVKSWCEEWDTFIQRIIDKQIGLSDQATRTKIGTMQPVRYFGD